MTRLREHAKYEFRKHSALFRLLYFFFATCRSTFFVKWPVILSHDVRESMSQSRPPISLAHKMAHTVWPSKRGPSKDELRHDRDDELVSLLLEVNLYPQKKT